VYIRDMRRALGLIATYAALVALAAACKDHTLVGDCFDSGATAYRVDLHSDTALTFRWPATSQPVKFYADNVGSLRGNTDFSLQMWEGAFRCGELAMTRVADSNVADVIIRNPAQMPPVPVNGPGELRAGRAPSLRLGLLSDSLNACDARTDIDVDTLTHEVLEPMRIYVAPADLDTALVNACYRISLAHEIGHTLGLLNHSGDPADLMYGNPQKRELSTNDRYTIQLVYHQGHVGLTPSGR
jgi:hypothetical protein